MENDIIWAAGLLEGEGTFVEKNNHSVNVSCHMTDLDVLEKLKSIFGGSIYLTTKRKDHWKQAWVWSMNGKDAIKVMTTIRPYMMSRRSQRIDDLVENWYDHQGAILEQNRLREENGLEAAKFHHARGKSLRQTAKQFNISHETLRKYLARVV